MNVYEFATPSRWQIGSEGDKPIYAGCAVCGDELLAGFVGLEPEIDKSAIIRTCNGVLFTPAIYCQEHLATWHRRDQALREAYHDCALATWPTLFTDEMDLGILELLVHESYNHAARILLTEAELEQTAGPELWRNRFVPAAAGGEGVFS